MTTEESSPAVRDLTIGNAELRIFRDDTALFAAAADEVLRVAHSALADRGRCDLALAGGSTPRRLYSLVAARAAELDWSRVHFFFGDERCVPPHHAESNYRMARETLLSAPALAAAHVHRIHAELPPAEAAAQYEQEMRAHFAAELPRFDLVLLGMGPDGHTASLFPGTGAVLERGVVALPVMPGAYVSPQVPRITLSAPVLQHSRALLMLIAGADKAEALAEVLDGPEQLDHRPLQLVRHARGQVRWLLDPAAAARL